ncbi:MAG: hypothetical protein JO084_05195 [Bradyrhizobiaceae bacterium]|nr:hypothetical protein [Bradyrhizobiaceae bacterium]
MSRRTFFHSHLISWGGLDFEIIDGRAADHRGRLDELREEVLQIAAFSRGWDDEESVALFRRTFKLGPLYEANALVLVYEQDRLVGLAGTVNDWTIDAGSIVHLCSLGLLPQVQRRGLLQAFMALLWIASLERPHIARSLARGALYTTAITQSPYILGLIQQIADMFPSPGREVPREDELRVARAVVARFDPHVGFEPASFILRNECEFRYRRMPASLDRNLTRFCCERLRHDEGDVFVVVGTVNPDRLGSYIERQRRQCCELLQALLQPVRAQSLPQLPDRGVVACVSPP